jgi:hypothetical protein
MTENILVFSEGRGQDGDARPEHRVSNVYKMYRISRDHDDTAIDPSQQVVFYDAGLLAVGGTDQWKVYALGVRDKKTGLSGF